MTTYQIREGKPQIGYYTDEVVTKEEYDTMHLYQMRKYWVRQQRR